MDNPAGRVILHCDGNSFYASVESIDHPEYREVPMAVGGDESRRHGIILAKNEKAKKYGIRTAETIREAKRKCPQLLIVPPHHRKYAEVSARINEIYCEYTDRVEPFSVDESWLDVTGSLKLKGTGEQIADELRKRIREEIGVTISAGVSFNKTFAKMGSDYKKPDATTVITRENFRELLWPLDIGEMLFVGKASAENFRLYGIRTIGDLAKADPDFVEKIAGKGGREVWECANGKDESPVALWGQKEDPKSVSNMVTFPKDLKTAEEMRRGLLSISEEVGIRLREAGFYASVVSVQLKDPLLKIRQKQMKLKNPTDLAQDIYGSAWQLASRIWEPGDPVRMITVGVSGLTKERTMQASLFEDAEDKSRQEELERTMDRIRKRFGSGSVKYAGSEKGRETDYNTDVGRRKP